MKHKMICLISEIRGKVMRKNICIILLCVIFILPSLPIPADASADPEKRLTLLYSGDMDGNIRPINE